MALSPSALAATPTQSEGAVTIKTLHFTACVNRKTKAVRVVISPRRCKRTERAIALMPTVQASLATIRYGIGGPTPTIGNDGDFYVDTSAYVIYGPRNSGNWGVGQSLVGPAGPQGPTGATGPAGATGATGATGSVGGFGSYGSFFDTDSHTLVANTATPIPLNTTDLASGISVVGGSAITMASAGKYSIAFSSQLYNRDNVRRTVTIWLSKNGTAQANWVVETSTDVVLGTSTDAQRGVAAWNFFVDAAVGDSYVLMIAANGSGVDLFGGDPLNTVPTGIPRIPSTIVTVNQVG